MYIFPMRIHLSNCGHSIFHGIKHIQKFQVTQIIFLEIILLNLTLKTRIPGIKKLFKLTGLIN